MEAHSGLNKYLLYGILVAGSWLLPCLLHLQFFHISIFHYTYLPANSGAGPAALPVNLFTAPPAVGDDDTTKSSSCEGRRVYMLDLPSRFNLLRDCVQGSPALEDETSACVFMSNAGLGPVLAPDAGNDTDRVIPDKGW
jgi:hypothetical protein